MEKAMAPHSSTLAWKIPWTEEPGKAAVHGVAKSWTRLSDFTFTCHFPALEKKMTTHSSVLAWRIPGTGEPGGLPSVGLHRVRNDWSDLAAAIADNPIKWCSQCVCVCVCVVSDSLVIIWTVAHQAPLSMGFFRQGYCSELPFPPPGDLPTPRIEPKSPVSSALQVNSLPLSH